MSHRAKQKSVASQAAISPVSDEVHVLRKGILGVQMTTYYGLMFALQCSSFTMEQL